METGINPEDRRPRLNREGSGEEQTGQKAGQEVSSAGGMSLETLNRWRLLLGPSADESLSETQAYSPETFVYEEIDELLGYLYDREFGEEQGYRRKQAGRGGSQLTVPGWLSQVRKLFPRETVEILEKQALDRYGISELLTDKKVLESLEPNMNLLKNILQFKGRMKGEVLASAKAIVRQVVEDLRRRLEADTRASISGKRNRYTSGRVRSLRNLNMKKTIVRNLKNYDREKRRFVVDRLHFDGRVQPYNRWHVIIAVDESGSMLDSVIYSSVMASIFYRLNALKTSLFVFDTEVVDLSGRLEDPVDVLMSVQLGGGTHIAKALRYGETLIENPGRTLFILVSDLVEGYAASQMYRAGKDILDAGARLLVLTALDFEGHAAYDEHAARVFADMGAEVAAITPDALAEWIGRIVN